MQIRISTAVSTVLVGLVCALPWVGAAAMNMPERGMTKTQVERQFGNPEQTRPAVGQPPISRWVYGDFTVYFEGDYTLHAVSHHAPEPAPAVVSGSATVTELPPIEEIDRAAEGETPDQRPRFRFDPASGRMMEVDAAGEPVAEPAAPASTTEQQPADAPAEDSAPDPAPEPAPEPAPPSAAPDTAAPADPPAESAEEPRFRFDPASGRIVLDDAPAADSAQPAPRDAAPQQPSSESATEQPAPEPAQPDTPEAPDAPETPASETSDSDSDSDSNSDNGGFFMQW